MGAMVVTAHRRSLTRQSRPDKNYSFHRSYDPIIQLHSQSGRNDRSDNLAGNFPYTR